VSLDIQMSFLATLLCIGAFPTCRAPQECIFYLPFNTARISSPLQGKRDVVQGDDYGSRDEYLVTGVIPSHSFMCIYRELILHVELSKQCIFYLSTQGNRDV
jgi:hypothetical protein